MTAIILTACIMLLCGIDLWCKAYIEKHFQYGEEREICNGKIVLRRVHNKGMALNAGDSKPHLVRMMSGVLCVILGVYYVILLGKSGNLMKKKGMMWILAGGFSNCYDRFVRKYVVDYFGFRTKWKKLSDITFNFGDMFIFLGAILMVITEFYTGRRKF